MRIALVFSLFLLAAPLALAAAPEARTQTLHIKAAEGSVFVEDSAVPPARNPSLTFEQGQNVTLVVQNEDAAPHAVAVSWEIAPMPCASEPVAEGSLDFLARDASLGAGENVTFQFDIPAEATGPGVSAWLSVDGVSLVFLSAREPADTLAVQCGGVFPVPGIAAPLALVVLAAVAILRRR